MFNTFERSTILHNKRDRVFGTAFLSKPLENSPNYCFKIRLSAQELYFGIRQNYQIHLLAKRLPWSHTHLRTETVMLIGRHVWRTVVPGKPIFSGWLTFVTEFSRSLVPSSLRVEHAVQQTFSSECFSESVSAGIALLWNYGATLQLQRQIFI
jgi:hypothetical protein